ncbi:MAG: DNA polymerase I [Acholeplasmataceae bacterium]
MKKLILIDGNSIMYRAYYATAYPGADLMKTSQGVYTNALFAFVNMFEKIVDSNETNVLVAFDTKEKTKRHLIYKDYKAGRAEMPEELIMQVPLIEEYIKLLGIKSYSKPGYEADDIIGTFAKEAAQKGYQIDIYSSDKDLLQLVNPNVTVNLLKKGMKEVHSFTPSSLYEHYELSHEQMIDLKALMGDASDNIPGLPGVGEKTAIKLLKEYGSLENIEKNKAEIKGKLGERIRENLELAFTSKTLVTIDCEAELDLLLSDLTKRAVDEAKLSQFFNQYELHVFVKKLNHTANEEEWDYAILTENEFAKIKNEPEVAIHFEFSDPNYHKATLWGIGLSMGKKHYFLTPQWLANKQFSKWLVDEKIRKLTYDYKAAKVFLLWQDLDIENVTFDLLLASYLVNSHLGKEEFKRIVSAFDYEGVTYDELVYDKGAKKKLPADETIYQKHIVSKAKAIYELKDFLINRLKEQEQLELLTELEIPLSTALASMEYAGLTVDVEELNRQKEELNKRIELLEQEIHIMAGEKFNVSSPKQMGEILFEKLNLPIVKKTKTGYSTDADVLNKLTDKHPIISLILEYRQLAKLYSTYIEGVRQNLFSDRKVHTIYMQALTTTGRLSSLDPNLQNIPIRTEEGRQIRKFFIAEKGNVLLGADYSQIELRVLADMANVKSLIEAFNNEVDIHTKTAQEVFHIEEITEEQRRHAKAVNFGIIYGIGAWSLSEDINVSPKEAQAFIDRYLTIYPEIKTYMEQIVKFAKENTYVETMLKRRRYIPELKSPVFTQRAFGERTALNAPIQGSAADIIKKAMVDIYQYLKKNKKKSKLILQVHDELILEVPNDELTEMQMIIPEMMENVFKLKVRLKTSCDIGITWYDLK